jgi:hypothetical protein
MIKREDKIVLSQDIEIAKNKLEFGKKETVLLSEEQKEILAIYQASKAYITKSKVSLFDESVKRIDSIYPSYNELLENIRRYLSGSIGVEVIKKQKYAINSDDLNKAHNLALKIVEKYKMAKDADVLIDDISNTLRSELSHNAVDITRLKNIMIKNEVITLDDI